MKTVYGPVPSWRLGRSLGIDIVCSKSKVCSFDCIYCQLGETVVKTNTRERFIELEQLIIDLDYYLLDIKADVLTLSGSGEPTLASNMGEVIALLRDYTDLPLAILTSSTLITLPEVRKELYKLDIVVAKLDAPNQELLEAINQPVEGILFEDIINGLKEFRNNFKGKLAVQIMFVNENKDYGAELAEIVRELQPDEVQLNTPLRPCPVKPLGKSDLEKIEEHFKDMNAISIYKAEKPVVEVIDPAEMAGRRKIIDF